MVMLRSTPHSVCAVVTARGHESSARGIAASLASAEECRVHSKNTSTLSSLSTDCASSSSSGAALDDSASDFHEEEVSDPGGDPSMYGQLVCSRAGVTLGSPRRQQFLFRAEDRQFIASNALAVKRADSNLRGKTSVQANNAEVVRRERPITAVTASGFNELVRFGTDGAAILAVESEGVNVKMEQCLEARSRHMGWLRKALQQQISEYQDEWTALQRQHVKELKEKSVLEHHMADTEQKVQERIRMRQHRERQVQETNTLLDAQRHAKLEAMQQREIAREHRLAKEAWWQQAIARERAATTAVRHEAVRKEGVRLAQEVKLARAAKMEVKVNKTEAVLCETRRINQLRKYTNTVADDCLKSMKNEILQQRCRSVIDVEALNQHMESLMLSLAL